MNPELTKLLAQRTANPAALEDLQAHIAQHQLRRAGDRERLVELALRGFFVLSLALLAMWASDDLRAWYGALRAPTAATTVVQTPSAAQCPKTP